MDCLREGCQIELHLMLLVNITNTEGGLSIFCQEGKLLRASRHVHCTDDAQRDFIMQC